MAWEEGIRALRTDATIGPLVATYGELSHRGNTKHFHVLISSIISQQISGKAADAIRKRLHAHFRPLTPATIVASDMETLRSLGLSPQKATYVVDLAHKFLDGTISPRKFSRLRDEEIIAQLVAVKGIGVWTAQMFLMFSLERIDVWPIDDYGIRKAIQVQFRKRALPKKKFMLSVGKRWAPYRSVAALYLWKSLENR